MFISIQTEKIVTPQPNALDQFWHDAVKHGEAHANISLTPRIEKYLVTILIGHLYETRFMDTPIALHFLEGIEKNDLSRLATAATTSLLILGLFPERTKRMLVSSSYLLAVGRSSYDHLAMRWEMIKRTHDAALARQARDSFEPMARVLRGMRMKENMFTLPVSK